MTVAPASRTVKSPVASQRSKPKQARTQTGDALQLMATESGVVQNIAALQRKADAVVLQRMPWPKKAKDRPNVAGTEWEFDAEALWEWCDAEDQFRFVKDNMSPAEWEKAKDVIKSSHWEDFAGSASRGDVTFIEYVKSQTAEKVTFKPYDVGTYVFPSDAVITALGAKSLTIDDLKQPAFDFNKGVIAEHDKAYVKEKWEKENNPHLSTDERREFNARADTARRAIVAAVETFSEDKRRVDEEAERKRVHDEGVQSVLSLAGGIAGFSAVQGDALANAVWEASVRNAGKTGYLEVAEVHPKSAVTAATALLRTFSANWTASGATTEAYMQNPHCPGEGNPQDKTGHSNEDLRGSLFQADFIAVWGGSRTVIHISSDSL